MNNQNSKAALKVVIVVGVLSVAALGIAYCLYPNRKKKTLKKNCSSIDLDVSVEITEDPLKNAINLKDRGNKYFKAGQYEKALECYEKAISLCPFQDNQELAKIYQNKAVALENMNNKEEALKSLNKALELFPKYEKALNRRSKLYEISGNLRDALNDITAASYFDDFRSPEYLTRMDKLIKTVSQQEANELEKNRDFSLPSSSYVKTYFESFPNDPLLNENFPPESGDSTVELLEKCLNMMRSKCYNDAFAEVRIILESGAEIKDEPMSRFLLMRGTFFFLSCHEELALQDFNSVIENRYARPDVTINALIKKALILMSLEKQIESENAFTEALNIDDNCPDIFYHRGSLFENTERFQEASDDFTRALNLQPNYSFAAVHKAFNNFRLNMGIAPDLTEFENLIEQYPKCLECHLIYSQLLLNMAKFIEVKRVCEKYLAVDSKSAPILMIYAMAQLSQGLESDARRLLNEAINCDPQYPYSYQTLASVYMKDGNLQRSLELMEKAIPLAKNRAELMSFVATREGVRAQLNVSTMYRIAPEELFASIMRSISPQHMM